jgi:hypothetical protein
MDVGWWMRVEAFEPMPCVVVLGMSDSPFLESEVLELRYEGELRLEQLASAPVLGFRGPSGELIVTAHQKILRYIDKIYLYTGLSSGTTLLEAKKNLCKAPSCDLTNCSSYPFCFLFVAPDKYFLGNILNF